jgi:O-antigen/teichoic acid export membrane protein
MNDQQSSGLSAKARAVLARNKDLVRNAGSLAATTGLTSIFGFVFWIVADHEYPKAEVGHAIAATNAMAVLGTIGVFGLGTMLIGELPKRRRDRGGLFAASLAATVSGSAVLGVIFAAVVGLYFSDAEHLPGIGGTPGQLLIFVAGVALIGASMVFDEGTIGLLRGGVQLWRNMAVSAIKLAMLPVLAVFLHDAYGVGISLSFVIAIAGSMIPAAVMLMRGGSSIVHRPDWQSLRRLLPVAVSHNWLNLTVAIPPILIPVVVPLAVGAAANSVFYDVWMITGLLFMVPIHLGTVLFALASASPEVIAEKLRFVLRISLLVGLPVMAVLAVAAHFALNLFGPGYAALGTIPLWLRILGYIPQMPKAQFIAVSRATNRVGRAAGLLGIFALFEVASIYFGGKLGNRYIGGEQGGLYGLSLAYLGVMVVEGVLTAPTVLRAAYAQTAAATGAFPAVSADVAATGAMAGVTGPLSRITGELIRLTGGFPQLPGAPDRQESGLAALFAITSAAVVSDGNTLNVATKIWQTGGFPALPPEATGPLKVLPTTATAYDLYLGQAAPGMKSPVQRATYQRRQQAGIDALLSIATSVLLTEDIEEEPALLSEDAEEEPALPSEDAEEESALLSEDAEEEPVLPTEDTSEDAEEEPVLPSEDIKEELVADSGDRNDGEDFGWFAKSTV